MITNGQMTLITGGARSGKSTIAESLAKQSGKKVHYIATMRDCAEDDELRLRISVHQKRRPLDWITHESPLELEKAIGKIEEGLVIVDCLSLYVSNLLLQYEGTDFYKHQERVLEQIEKTLQVIKGRKKLEFIVVTSEVGSSVVPDNSLARAYRDCLGLSNQLFAQQANEVLLAVAGLMLKVK